MTKKEILILQGTDPTFLLKSQISWLTGRQISWLTESQKAKIKKQQKRFKWEKPYTNLLRVIKKPGNSLEQTRWHTCETTHCIAGGTVTLAPNGKQLESEIGTGPAARAILSASRPYAPLPRFDGSAQEDAIMAFIEARAEEEK